MINISFKFLLTFNATSLILVVYLVKSQIVINDLHPYLMDLPSFVSYFSYFSIPVFLTYFSLYLSKWLDDDSLELDNGVSPIKAIEQANNAYLPSYLAYFFVALSIPNFDTLIFVYLILFIFTFLSQTLYFNPLFLFFQYHFYYMTTKTDIKIFIITKKEQKDPSKISFPKLKRINNFTFINKE